MSNLLLPQDNLLPPPFEAGCSSRVLLQVAGAANQSCAGCCCSGLLGLNQFSGATPLPCLQAMQFPRKNSLQACVSLSSSGNVTKKEGSPTTPLSVTVNSFQASKCFPRKQVWLTQRRTNRKIFNGEARAGNGTSAAEMLTKSKVMKLSASTGNFASNCPRQAACAK